MAHLGKGLWLRIIALLLGMLPLTALADSGTLERGGVFRLVRPDGSRVDCLAAGIATSARSLAGMTLSVSGPDGFAANLTAADITPLADGHLEVTMEYPAEAKLPAGVYTFTLADGAGHVSHRVAPHAAQADLSQAVDSATIRWQRTVDGAYRFWWGEVNGPRPGYYRLRLEKNDGSGQAAFLTGWTRVPWQDLAPGVMVDGSSYAVSIETAAAPDIALLAALARSGSVKVTPQPADYNPLRLLLTHVQAATLIADNGSRAASFSFAVSTPAEAAAVSAVVLRSADGFSAVFRPEELHQAGSTEFTLTSAAPLPSGAYTLHIVANGIDHPLTVTLGPPVDLPAPEAAYYAAEETGNGTIRFNWAGADHAAPLYYQVQLKNSASGELAESTTVEQTSVEMAIGPFVDRAAITWRVVVADGPSAATMHARLYGSFFAGTLASLPFFDASLPQLKGFLINNLSGGNNRRSAIVEVVATAGSGTITEIRVSGPDGFQRDLLAAGETAPGSGRYLLAESGPLPAGLYGVTLKNSSGRSATKQLSLAPFRELPPVDSRFARADWRDNGDLDVSWPRIFSDRPLCYRLEALVHGTPPGVPLTGTSAAGGCSGTALPSLVVPAGALPQSASYLGIAAYDGPDGSGNLSMAESFAVTVPVPLPASVKATGGVSAELDSPLPVTKQLPAEAATTQVIITTKPLSVPFSFKGGKKLISFTAPIDTTIEALIAEIAADSWITPNLATLKFSKGKGKISFTVAANEFPEPRSGTITIGSAVYSLPQRGAPCAITSLTVSPLTPMPAVGGDVSLAVNVKPDTCSWQVAAYKIAPELWFSAVGTFPPVNVVQNGDLTLSGSVAQNSIGKPRTNTITVVTADGKSRKNIRLKQLKATIFSLSGKVTLNGAGLAGVTMTLSGATSATTSSDADGNYTFSGLANGSYTVTPARTGHTFTPPATKTKIRGVNLGGVNFLASAASIFSISGNVTANGAGLAGVTMTLSGASTATTTTDSGGNYTFSSLANGSYTVTPSRTGFAFTPATSPQTVNNADITGVAFSATAVPTFSISGSVTLNSAPLAGVTMTLSGAGVATTTTDVNGNFTFSGLANGSYTVTPGRTGFVFTPSASPQTVNNADISGVAFSATEAPIAAIVTCPAAGTTNVSIRNFSFLPGSVSIAADTIVRWTNNDSSSHTVTSGTSPTANGTFDSGILPPGGTVCIKFSAPGTYAYFCALHTFMTATLTVNQ